MEEKEDAFFCGEVKEKSFAEELKELHLSLVGEQEPIIQTESAVFDYSPESSIGCSIFGETIKLRKKVSDAAFVRIWEQSPTMWDVLISLEEPLRQVITGVPMIIAIHNRARKLRSKGVNLQKFTI